MRDHQNWLDRFLGLLLAAAVGVLLLQLSWPQIEAWRNRPVAGRQVLQTWSPRDPKRCTGIAARYWLYLPKEFRNRGESWPLILYLHGAGERGTDPHDACRLGLPSRLGNTMHVAAIVASPQCVTNAHWEPESLLCFLDELQLHYPVDQQQIYVVGHSMGGFGAWELAAAAPEKIAAIVPLCGGGTVSSANSLSEVPVWALHGDADDVVPAANSEEMVKAVRAAGGSAKLTLLRRQGHRIENQPIDAPEILRWLLAQRKTTSGHESPIKKSGI